MQSMFSGLGSMSFGLGKQDDQAAKELCTVEPRECTDLASLEPLTQDSLVAMVRARYEEAKIRPFGGRSQHELIYTRAGAVVVAVNPLTPVPDLYTEAQRRKSHRAALAELRRERGTALPTDEAEEEAPHIYEVAGRAYHRMREGRCQAAVINGESGAVCHGSTTGHGSHAGLALRTAHLALV
jgi:myosin heavy subunit